MRTLITGAGGFVGKHLLAYLEREQAKTTELHGTIYSEMERQQFLKPGGASFPLWQIDLCNSDSVQKLLADLRPDRIFHLAGQAYVPQSFQNPWETLENNIRGTLNLLHSIHTLGLATRVLVVGSADIYGAAPISSLPLTEDAPFLPSSPYSVSKIAQDMLALQYTRSYNLFTIRARPFNHIGPGQNQRFAISDWASQIAGAEAGKREPIVYVGDLSAARDFTDVRDVVRAYVLALEQGTSGAVYNVCSGQPHTMRSILETLVSMSTTSIEIRISTERFRPVEIPVLYGDYHRLQAATGWEPQIPLEQSLQDVLTEWRQHLSNQ